MEWKEVIRIKGRVSQSWRKSLQVKRSYWIPRTKRKDHNFDMSVWNWTIRIMRTMDFSYQETRIGVVSSLTAVWILKENSTGHLKLWRKLNLSPIFCIQPNSITVKDTQEMCFGKKKKKRCVLVFLFFNITGGRYTLAKWGNKLENPGHSGSNSTGEECPRNLWL